MAPVKETHACFIKQLPERLHEAAAKAAVDINPLNAPFQVAGGDGQPARLARLNMKYWGPAPRTLTVSFLEKPERKVQERILSHMNAWDCAVSFKLVESGGEVRISLLGGGFWSYLGTDILLVPKDRPTMNLQGFNAFTPESEYKRVVRHETGHTLGFPHEHLRKEVVERIDPDKAYTYFAAVDDWPKQMVDANVLTPLDDKSIMGTPIDTDSIMCYQLPGEIMRDGKPVPGGKDINDQDAAFCHTIYPKPAAAAASKAGGACCNGANRMAVGDWGPEEDVDVEAIRRQFVIPSCA